MSNFKNKHPFSRIFICAGFALASINCFAQLEQIQPPPPPGTPAPNQLADACPNIPGNQPVYPPGYTIDALGNCVLVPATAAPNAPTVVPAPAAPPIAGQPAAVPAPGAPAPVAPAVQSPAPPAPGAPSLQPAPVVPSNQASTPAAPAAPAPAVASNQPGAPVTTTVPNVIPPPPPPANNPPAPSGPGFISRWWSNSVAWFSGYVGWAKEHPVKAGIYLALILLALFLVFRSRRIYRWVRARGELTTIKHVIAMILIPAATLALMSFSAVAMDAATLNPDALTAGVPGNNYDVVFNGTGFASASGAYFWCPGVSTTFLSASDTQLKLRVTISATAVTNQICGLRVFGVNPTQGYQDFANRLAVGDKSQYGAAQMVPFVQHYAPLVPPAPPAAPPVDKTARQTANAAKTAANNALAVNNRLRSEIDSLKADVAAMKVAPAPVPTPVPVLVPTANPVPSPAPAPAPSNELASAMGRIESRLNSLDNRVGGLTAEVGKLQSNVEQVNNKVDNIGSGVGALAGFVIADGKNNKQRCERYARAVAAGIHVVNPEEAGCKVK